VITVYIASPYSKETEEENKKQVLQAAEVLANLGYCPFAPLLSYYNPESFWLIQSIEWVRRCDVLLRLSGESRNADQWVITANSHGIPVYYSIESLFENVPTSSEEEVPA
jgi:hypothetical protein